MVTAEDVISIYALLTSAGIPVWLTGGWGIDALLREQTRAHKDVDVLLMLEDVARTREIMSQKGFALHELWSENRWAADANGAETVTAFVLRDAGGRQLDVHAIHFDERGRGIPAWEDEGLLFDDRDLSGEGAVAGLTVRCLAARTQMRLHSGYPLPAEQVRDLERLSGRFRLQRLAWQRVAKRLQTVGRARGRRQPGRGGQSPCLLLRQLLQSRQSGTKILCRVGIDRAESSPTVEMREIAGRGYDA